MPKMCFSYPSAIGDSGALPPLRGSRVFSYPDDALPGIGNRSVVQPVRDSKLCFSYQADIPLGIGNRDAAPPAPSVRRMAGGSCFRY